MFTSFARHFFRAIWHVKVVILMLVALMAATLVFAVRESLEESRKHDRN